MTKCPGESLLAPLDEHRQPHAEHSRELLQLLEARLPSPFLESPEVVGGYLGEYLERLEGHA